MPQLVKGGKFVFGWCLIGEDGGIALPEAARQEYGFRPDETVALLPGSRTSGGFCIAGKPLLEKSRLGGRRTGHAARLENERLRLSPQVLEAFGLKPGDCLLAVRGSYLGLGMAARGPILEEARKHREMAVFRP